MSGYNVPESLGLIGYPQNAQFDGLTAEGSINLAPSFIAGNMSVAAVAPQIALVITPGTGDVNTYSGGYDYLTVPQTDNNAALAFINEFQATGQFAIHNATGSPSPINITFTLPNNAPTPVATHIYWVYQLNDTTSGAAIASYLTLEYASATTLAISNPAAVAYIPAGHTVVLQFSLMYA